MANKLKGRTPEARARTLANLDPQARTKHGLKSTLSPDRWAPEWSIPYRERMGELLSLECIDGELDRGMVAVIARTEVMLGRCYEYLGENGLTGKAGRMRPAVAHCAKLERDLAMFYSQAGLTPTSRRRLALATGPIGISELVSAAGEDIEDVDGKDGDGNAGER